MKQKNDKPVITYINETKAEIRIGDICFLVDSVYGDTPVDEIMTEYVAEQFKAGGTADNKIPAED
jgi:hypothetical protein